MIRKFPFWVSRGKNRYRFIGRRKLGRKAGLGRGREDRSLVFYMCVGSTEEEVGKSGL